jgi:hypothetical protein
MACSLRGLFKLFQMAGSCNIVFTYLQVTALILSHQRCCTACGELTIASCVTFLWHAHACNAVSLDLLRPKYVVYYTTTIYYYYICTDDIHYICLVDAVA